jgi:hypothetical protein
VVQRILTILLACAAVAISQTRIEVHGASSAVISERLQLEVTKNDERRARLVELFEQAGCTGDRLTSQDVQGVKPPNIICTLPGESKSMIVIGAHFDQVDRGHGIVDNWSGASLLPSLFGALKDKPRRHTLVFIGFSGEERGLLGSRAYVKQFKKDDIRQIQAMVNMDTMGLGTTAIWFNRADKQLVSLLADISNQFNIPVSNVNFDKVGSTDSESFRERRVPSITFHSITQQTFPILHSVRDTIQAIHMNEYYESYRLMAFYLAYIDQKLELE